MMQYPAPPARPAMRVFHIPLTAGGKAGRNVKREESPMYKDVRNYGWIAGDECADFCRTVYSRPQQNLSGYPLGIITLLKRWGIETSGKKCVILGRSNIVGKPMAQLMMQKNYGDATVTVCHSHSKTLKEECRQADIIIAAIGQPDFVTADMVKEGAVVIDVGTTRVPDATRKSGFRLNGDVKFDEVAEKCSYITPVPGGVGPMTICSLMKNTLAAGRKEFYG